MIGFASFTEADFLGLNKIADMCILTDLAAGTQVRVRAEDGAARNGGVVEDASVANDDIGADGGVLDHTVTADAAAGGDLSGAKKLHERFENGVRLDFDGGVN